MWCKFFQYVGYFMKVIFEFDVVDFFISIDE